MTTITSESVLITKKGINFSEHDYFNTDRQRLKSIACPNCSSKGGLFKGFNAFGCYECFQYFTEEEILSRLTK